MRQNECVGETQWKSGNDDVELHLGPVLDLRNHRGSPLSSKSRDLVRLFSTPGMPSQV